MLPKIKNFFFFLLFFISINTSAKTIFSGAIDIRPIFMAEHQRILVNYYIDGSLRTGTIFFNIDYQGWYPPQTFKYSFPTVYELLDREIDSMQHCCSLLTCGFPTKANSINQKTQQAYEETNDYLNFGSLWDIEGVYNTKNIEKLKKFKAAVVDQLPETRYSQSIWTNNISYEDICKLLAEYNLGTGFVLHARNLFDDPAGKINTQKKFTLRHGKVFLPDERFTFSGTVKELSQINIIGNNGGEQELGITGDTLNERLAHQIHNYIRRMMENYLYRNLHQMVPQHEMNTNQQTLKLVPKKTKSQRNQSTLPVSTNAPEENSVAQE